MTTISSVSSAWSSASVQRASRPGPSPERLLSKIDADGSGGVDSTELEGLLDKVAQKTGVSGDTSASDLLTQFDANGDGNLNADELGKTMESLMPARSTMDFAQARSADASSSASNAASAKGQAGDDLFGKVDSDGDGSVSKTELQALLEAMSGGTASQTGVSSDDAFAALDADGDGSLSQAEFDAGRPSGDGPQAGGMPPPGGPGGPGGAGGPRGAGGAQASSESTTYDPLDTNEDGVVSIAERLAGSTSTSGQDAITALFNAIDTDGDQSISSAESQSFIDQLTSQLQQSASNASGQSSSRNKDGSQSTDLARLADFARQQYARAANDWSASSRASTLSAVA